eukprot:6457417-Amphidinium_carterae.1
MATAIACKTQAAKEKLEAHEQDFQDRLKEVADKIVEARNVTQGPARPKKWLTTRIPKAFPLNDAPEGYIRTAESFKSRQSELGYTDPFAAVHCVWCGRWCLPKGTSRGTAEERRSCSIVASMAMYLAVPPREPFYGLFLPFLP